MTGVAVNVTVDPRQKGLEDATIETPTGNMGLIVIVTVLDIAGFPVGQSTFELSVQVIASPLVGT